MTSAPDTAPSHLAPHQMVAALERRCLEQPDRVAVGDADRNVTFAELHQWVGGAAARFAELDQDPVAVLTDRSVESMMACIAVLWAGRCMVPLDVHEPAGRLERILDRVGPCNLVDATGTVGGSVLGRPVLDIHRPVLQHFAPVACAADSLAVLFFTSGSTGEPKGVQRTRAQQDLYFHNRQGPEELPGRHLAAFSPMHFAGGLATNTIVPALGRGATLMDLSRMTVTDVMDRIERDGIDSMFITPSLVHSLAAATGGRRMAGVHWVATFGELVEWVEIDLIRRFAAEDVTVLAQYGASETLATYTVHRSIPHDVPSGDGPVALRPPSDPGLVRFDPLPDSDTLREIVLVRDVIDHYWKDPELSAARFAVDEHGVPCWHSGDLVVLDDEGFVHMSGRVDDMVKVNGRLVEPAEPQKVLRAIPGVRHAVLLPRHLPDGRSQFVAHLEVDDAVTPESVWTVLRRDLPAHLVPGVLVRHDPIPLTDRGKVDRGTLRSMSISPWRSASSADEHDMLATGIAGLAATLLDIPDLGPDDDLWDMGCDSLGAIELAETLRSVHGAHVEPNDLIAAPTPRALAALMRRSTPARSATVVVHAEGWRPLVTLVAGGGGPAVQYHALAAAFGPDQPMVIHEQLGLHQRWARDHGVVGQARRCVAELRARQPVGPYRLIGHSYGGLVAHEMARMLEAEGERSAVVIVDTIQHRGRPVAATSTWRSRSRLYRALFWPYLLMREVVTRPGSAARYRVMFQRTLLTDRAFRNGVVQGPVMVIRAADGVDQLGWEDQPGLITRTVAGTHLTMIQPPFATDVAAAAIDAFALLDAP